MVVVTVDPESEFLALFSPPIVRGRAYAIG
jgi:hypothetical protein